MSIQFPRREPAPTSADIRRMIREEIDFRLETLVNLATPVPDPPGLLQIAFDGASLAANVGAALVITLAKSVIR